MDVLMEHNQLTTRAPALSKRTNANRIITTGKGETESQRAGLAEPARDILPSCTEEAERAAFEHSTVPWENAAEVKGVDNQSGHA
jgi:hypothetical protein